MWSILKSIFGGRGAPRLDVSQRFELLSRTGQGSMSKVWRARDRRTGRLVALKLLDVDKTDRFEARFHTKTRKPLEGEIAVQLKHPHIVETYEWGWTTSGEQYLVMEFIEGCALSYLVDTQNETMRSGRLNFMLQLGEAVQCFHERGWIHRDICPRNVMVTDDGAVKLIDFGLVVPNLPEFQAPGNRTGTLSYMAPELLKRQPTDQRIDVFSYATTCYEMCAAKLPWEPGGKPQDVTRRRLNVPPRPLLDAAPETDPALAAVIMQGLERAPNDRWRSIREMTDALQALPSSD